MMNSAKGLPIFMNIALIVLFCCSIEGKKTRIKTRKVREGQPTRFFPMSSKPGAIRLRCGKGRVIYSIDISSHNVSSRKGGDDDVCSGLQPGVLADVNRCYWGRKCTIQFSSVQPIVQTCCVQCVGHNPNRLGVSYLCLKKDKINFLGSARNMDLSSDCGMLVSHVDYPWNYQPNIEVKLTMKPRDRTKRKLYLMVHHLEIDEFDRVLLRNSKGDNLNITNTKLSKVILAEGSFSSVLGCGN